MKTESPLANAPDAKGARRNGRSGTFVDNMALPVHRWFRYSAGFSAEWVRAVVRDRLARMGGAELSVLDPFAGVGTTLIACDAENVESLGLENHPFIHRVSVAKLRGIRTESLAFLDLFKRFMNSLPGNTEGRLNSSPLLSKCYATDTLSKLISMRNHFLEGFDKGTGESELLWLAITSILRQCSNVATAQWQYVLPNKKRAYAGQIRPQDVLTDKVRQMLEDMDEARFMGWESRSRTTLTDARNPEVSETEFDLVVTSPPYPNNYDYADATRLELTFWGEIAGWGDLQGTVRKNLIRSCSQHAAAEKLVLDELLAEPAIEPIREGLSDACRELAKVRLTRAGRKTYHTMAAAYFRDIALVFQSLRPMCRDGSTMCFVVGDSAPYGVYLHVDRWFGDLALAAGFKSYKFEKLRDRNIKWKNRKHRVPLKEGRLWVDG